MNLFQKYGIKEVADVVFYSITSVGDEEIYTPVLFLDTLKVSTLEKTAEKVSAQGGKGNKKLITWNFGKEVTLNLEDALFTPASMSLTWGGQLEAKLSPYTSAIVKINMANKYGSLHYSTKAYPSPALTDEEWEIVFRAATELKMVAPHINPDEILFNPQEDDTGLQKNTVYWTPDYSITKDEGKVEENRVQLVRYYFGRFWNPETKSIYREVVTDGAEETEETTYEKVSEAYENALDYKAMPYEIVEKIISYIDNIKKIGHVETQIYDTEVIDRMERCVVKDKEGLIISTSEQKKNLLRYYKGDQTSSYCIYYDPKTMQPMLSLTDDGTIRGWDQDGIYDKNFNMITDTDHFRLKMGTIYYKWTRTVKYKDGTDDGILGRTFVIDADTFPEAYKIVGETYIRDQKTNKDHRFQFVINRAVVSADTNITLEAEGDPTTFSMSVDVLTPPNDIMIELKEFDVDEDRKRGGTKIVPQKSRYSYTPTTIEQKIKTNLVNNEIY